MVMREWTVEEYQELIRREAAEDAAKEAAEAAAKAQRAAVDAQRDASRREYLGRAVRAVREGMLGLSQAADLFGFPEDELRGAVDEEAATTGPVAVPAV